jgi:hypothetical protein
MHRLMASALGAALLIGMAAPAALGAQRVTDIRMHNFDVISPLFPDQLCGISSVFQSTWSYGSFSLVEWDDGRTRVSFNFIDSITDTSTGEVIARAAATHAEFSGPGGLPFSVKHTVAAVCTPESMAPGHEITISFGVTVNELGELTQLHETVIEH